MSNRFFEENILENEILDATGIEQDYDSGVQYQYCAISGKVVDVFSRVPMAGVSIDAEAFGAALTTIDTNAQGFFEIPFNVAKNTKSIDLKSRKFSFPAIPNEEALKNALLDSLHIDEEHRIEWTLNITKYKSSGNYNTLNGRTNIVLEVGKDYIGTADGLNNLAQKGRLLLKIQRSSISDLPNITGITQYNCTNYFNLKFYEYVTSGGDRIQEGAIEDNSWLDEGNSNALSKVNSVNLDADYLTFEFVRPYSPAIYDIGVLSVTLAGYDNIYAPCKFQIYVNDETVEGIKVQHPNQISILAFQKYPININSNITIYLRCIDENNVLRSRPADEDIKVYVNGKEKPFSTAGSNSDLTIFLSSDVILTTNDIIVIDAKNFYATSIVLLPGTIVYGTDPNIINFIYGDQLNGSTISMPDNWYLWSTYAFPWYENLIDIKYAVKDINFGEKKEFIEENLSIFSVRNTNREIDGANVETKLLIENGELKSEPVKCNQIVVSRPKTISNKQYVFNIPLYQECYPSQMIFKRNTSSTIDLHRYTNSEITIKYRTKNPESEGEDIYKNSLVANDIKVTYLNKNLNSRNDLNIEYLDNIDNRKIENSILYFSSKPGTSNNEIKVLLRGNLGNTTYVTYENVYFEPKIDKVTDTRIAQNIGLVSAIYNTMVCHDENFILNSMTECLEYTFGYSYGLNLPLGQFNCTFKQDNSESNFSLSQNNKLQYHPKVTFNNSNIEINDTNLIAKANLNGNDNTFTETDNATHTISGLSYSYEYNSEHSLPITYKVVSNPECIVNNISFNYKNRSTYEVDLTGGGITYTEKYFSGAINNGTVSANNLFLVTIANITDDATISNDISVNIPEENVNDIVIDENGISIYNSYVLSSEDYTINYKLNNDNSDFAQSVDDVTINGKNTLSDIVCYSTINNNLTSVYNAERIVSTIDAENLGYIYSLDNGTYTYTSNEIEKNINKYYNTYISNTTNFVINELMFNNITEGITPVYSLKRDSNVNNSIISQIENDKFISIKVNNTDGLYAEFLNTNDNNDYIYTAISNIKLSEKNNNVDKDICDNRYTELSNLLISNIGHNYICNSDYALIKQNGSDFQDRFGLYAEYDSSAQKCKITYNDSNQTNANLTDLVTRYINYVISQIRATENDHSYDHNPATNDLNAISGLDSIYKSIYDNNDLFSIRNLSDNMNSTTNRDLYYYYIYPYESLRSSQDDTQFPYKYWTSENTESSEYATLRNYFSTYTNDADYQTSLDYITNQRYGYGLAYNYVYNMITGYCHSSNGNIYVLKVKQPNISQGDWFAYYDGTTIQYDRTQTLPNDSVDIANNLLSFLTDYNNVMTAEYNKYFTYVNGNSARSLTVSDISTIFENNIKLVDLIGNIYEQYDGLKNALNNAHLSLKMSDSDNDNSNYIASYENIATNVDIVNLCKDIYTSFNSLFKETIGTNINPIDILAKCNNDINTAWNAIFDLLKYFKTNNVSVTTNLQGTNYYELSITAVDNDLVTSGASKIFVIKSIYDRYRVFNSTVLNNLKNTSNDNSVIYESITNDSTNYNNIKPIVNKVIEIIIHDCQEVIDRFNIFQPLTMNVHNELVTPNINNILRLIPNGNTMSLYIKNYDFFDGYNIVDLYNEYNYLISNGVLIIIRKYLTRAYNYTLKQIEDSTELNNKLSSQITLAAINSEVNFVRNYLKNIILNLNNNPDIDINIRYNVNDNYSKLSKFNPNISIHPLNLVTKHYYGYNLYYFNNLDFITGIDGLHIKYFLGNTSEYTILDIIQNNMNNLNIFNGTIKIDNAHQQSRYLYLYLCYYGKIYKQLKMIDLNTPNNIVDVISLDINLNTERKEINKITKTFDNFNNSLNVNFDVTGFSSPSQKTAKLKFDWKKNGEINWHEQEILQTIRNQNINIPIEVEYNDISIMNNIYIFRYRIEYFDNNVKYSHTDYHYDLYVVNSASNYNYRITHITEPQKYEEQIEGTGILYLKTQQNNSDSAYWWYATISDNINIESNNDTINCLKFKMIDKVYKYDENEEQYNEFTTNTVQPNIGQNYYNSFKYLYIYSERNKYDLSLTLK